MGFIYTGRIQLVDEHGFLTQLQYPLGDETDNADAPTALAKVNAIAAELVDVTSSNIASVTMLIADDTNQNFSIPSEAENAEEAVLSVHLTASPAPAKYGILRIPAPVNGLFLGDKYTVDTTNVALQAYVTAVADNALISDGESIVLARGVNGVADGSWRTKARKAPK